MDSLLETFKQELIAQEKVSDPISQAPRIHNQVALKILPSAPVQPVCVFCQHFHFLTNCFCA